MMATLPSSIAISSKPYDLARARGRARAEHGYRDVSPRVWRSVLLRQPLDDGSSSDRGSAAHRDERGRRIAALELVERRHEEPRSGGADRMAEGDRAAVHVQLVHVR